MAGRPSVPACAILPWAQRTLGCARGHAAVRVSGRGASRATTDARCSDAAQRGGRVRRGRRARAARCFRVGRCALRVGRDRRRITLAEGNGWRARLCEDRSPAFSADRLARVALSRCTSGPRAGAKFDNSAPVTRITEQVRLTLLREGSPEKARANETLTGKTLEQRPRSQRLMPQLNISPKLEKQGSHITTMEQFCHSAATSGLLGVSHPLRNQHNKSAPHQSLKPRQRHRLRAA